MSVTHIHLLLAERPLRVFPSCFPKKSIHYSLRRDQKHLFETLLVVHVFVGSFRSWDRRLQIRPNANYSHTDDGINHLEEILQSDIIDVWYWRFHKFGIRSRILHIDRGVWMTVVSETRFRSSDTVAFVPLRHKSWRNARRNRNIYLAARSWRSSA